MKDIDSRGDKECAAAAILLVLAVGIPALIICAALIVGFSFGAQYGIAVVALAILVAIIAFIAIIKKALSEKKDGAQLDTEQA